MPKGFWWGDLNKIDHLKARSVGDRIILKGILKEHDGRA
jgi:hypothetical protein